MLKECLRGKHEEEFSEGLETLFYPRLKDIPKAKWGYEHNDTGRLLTPINKSWDNEMYGDRIHYYMH